MRLACLFRNFCPRCRIIHKEWIVMLKAIREKFRLRDMRISRKLLAVTLGVALLISTVSLGGFQLVANQSNHMIYTQTASALNAISDKIASRLNNLIDTSLYIAVNRGFQNNLSALNGKSSTSSPVLARSEITSLIYRTFHSDIITISVFPLQSSSIVLGFDFMPQDKEIYAKARTMAAQAKGAPVWLATGRSDGSVFLAKEIRSLSEPFLEPMGLLLLRVNLDKIVRESAENLLSGEYDIAISQNGEHLYPYAGEGQTAQSELAFRGDSLYAIGRQDGEMRFNVRSGIRAFNLHWDLVLSIPYNDVFRSLVVANMLFAACLMLAAVLTTLISRRMLGGINRDIRLLTDKMDRVRKGDLEPYPNPPTLGRDELGNLNRHFDEMTVDFKQVIEDNYVKELLLTQTQLKALEQQINPHFLYNSLEAVYWFSHSGECEQVASIAHALGRLLRSTLSENEDSIPLKQELGILDSYLSIQRIRFPDTLRVQMQVQKEALDALVPKMSIQPLVENAIIHSLEENIGECHISIRVALKEEMIRVEVENDGSEIDEDILNKLREKKVEPKGQGIGLINIDSRIKLLFGQEYGIRLRSLQNRVIVSFCIPACIPAGTGEASGPKTPAEKDDDRC